MHGEMSIAVEGTVHYDADMSAGDGTPPGNSAAVIAFVNGSRETFTPTISGAIATSIWQLVQDPCLNIRRPVLTRFAGAEPYPCADLHILRPSKFVSMRGRRGRDIGRFTGWTWDGQRAYARAALRCLRSLRLDVVICHNEPEIAAYLAHKLPYAQIMHYFRNVMVPRHPRWRRRYWRASRYGHVVSFAVNSYFPRAVDSIHPLRTHSVAAIPYGVDCQQFSPHTDHKDHGAASERAVIIEEALL